MQCPKCQALNADEAVCCTLCFETFKPKAKASEGGGRGSKKIATNETTTTFDDWTSLGPFAVTENGVYFFVKGMKMPRHEGAGQSAGKKIGEHLGLAGYVLGAVAGSIIDNAVDKGESGAGLYRPDKIVLSPTRDVLDQCRSILGDAPDIPSCKEFFSFSKPEVKEIGFSFLGNLQVYTRFLYLEVSGIPDPDRFSAFLRLHGYPLKG